jgi:hypothetical protein
MTCDYTASPGLDVARGSTPPWYSAADVHEMAASEGTGRVRASSGMIDDPWGGFLLVVNNQGEGGPPPFEGKLARLSGEDAGHRGSRWDTGSRRLG